MIRNEATQNQVTAADPLHTTWLSANAGSGKTRVLTDRVARLLLNGVQPQNILCLTYTKAAAAEMQNRLFKRLGAWAMLDNESLQKDLRELGVEGDLDLANARTLFARAIETPGGLKIQTIHSFCSSILRRFPLEAKVSPQFREMEDRTAELLRAEVLDDIVASSQVHVVRNLLNHHTGAELDSLVATMTRHRDFFENPLDEASLRERLQIASGLSLEVLLDNVFGPDEIKTLRAITAVCQKGSSTEVKAAARLAKLNLSNPSQDDLTVLEGLFLFGKDAKAGPFTAKIGSFPTKATAKANPELVEDLNILMETVENTRQDRMALNAFERTKALYAFGEVFVPAYEDRKLAMGLLDFEDLIRKARYLLTDPLVAQWVLFRLDGGIDHVLVDEAQDTSPDQWAVIKHLTQEFLSGDGARADRLRTIFVVGDKKQSIYSFQGADPDEFDRMQAHFDEKLRDAQDRLHNLTLQHSFRSSQAVLRVVDATFDGANQAGLGGEVFHTAFKENMPGRVDIWPVVPKNPSATEEREWFDPIDQVSDTHHTVQLANQIAAEIKRMIAEETIPVEVENTDTYTRRQVTEGDILILVQRRSDLFSEIIRACKTENLSIAGADRMRIGAELAVKDLAAVLNFLALPEDDLSLAAALRSPLFGWSEQDLFSLAHHRPAKGYLWPALRDSNDHPKTLAVLKDLRAKSDFLRPYDLLERILIRHDGRRKLLSRLGAEAEDGIDALLSQALVYESQGVPSLTGFLTWLQTDDLVVKRQMDSQGNRIRVMTVHGAKGLEAPIVFLPDTAKRPNNLRSEIYKTDSHLIWRTPANDSADVVVDIRDDILETQERERMRLLYVAMTRAEKWLIVAGAGDVGEGSDSWYTIAAEGAEKSGWVDDLAGDLEIKRVSHLDWNGPPRKDTAPEAKSAVEVPVFDHLPAVTTSKTLSPSDLGGAKALFGDPSGDDLEAALAKGRLVHLLLEHLPQVGSADRESVGARLIAASSDYTAEASDLIQDVIALIENPDLADLFSDATMAEVGITATIPGLNNARIHGAIDLLQITDDAILAVDFKTNKKVPDTAEETPEGLLRQMGAYAAALAKIYPNHRIETAILWTQNATLMRLPDQLVSNALLRVSVP